MAQIYSSLNFFVSEKEGVKKPLLRFTVGSGCDNFGIYKIGMSYTLITALS